MAHRPHGLDFDTPDLKPLRLPFAAMTICILRVEVYHIGRGLLSVVVYATSAC